MAKDRIHDPLGPVRLPLLPGMLIDTFWTKTVIPSIRLCRFISHSPTPSCTAVRSVAQLSVSESINSEIWSIREHTLERETPKKRILKKKDQPCRSSFNPSKILGYSDLRCLDFSGSGVPGRADRTSTRVRTCLWRRRGMTC